MKIEYRLRAILQQYGLDSCGYQLRIEHEAGVPRKVVAAMCNGKLRTVSLEHLERLYNWLRQQGVPLSVPGDLLAFDKSGLLSTLAAPGKVMIYLGKYRQCAKRRTRKTWLAEPDYQLDAVLVQLFSGLSLADRATAAGAETNKRPTVSIEHVQVPSRVAESNAPGPGANAAPAPAPALGLGPGAPAPSDSAEAGDITTEARRIYLGRRRLTEPETFIMIGSQWANFMFELFAADLLGCAPFTESHAPMPFYIVKPDDDLQRVTSCCGGPRHPPGCHDSTSAGIWYRDRSGGWWFAPSRKDKRDAGLVIIRRDLKMQQTEMAIFGVSGAATAAMGEILRKEPDRLWGEPQRLGGQIEIRMMLCRFRMSAESANGSGESDAGMELLEIIPLSLPANGKQAVSKLRPRAA